mgnify:CR=1 FL=1
MGQNHQQIKKTSNFWAEELGIKVLNFSAGFNSSEEFLDKFITKEDFLTRISNCEIQRPEIQSRRQAYQLKKKLVKNLD